MNWVDDNTEFAALDAPARALLGTLDPVEVPRGTVLFCPGEAVKGYVVMLSGQVDVNLIGPNGRDILLYRVEPGQSCIQSTLGLLGGDAYTGEAMAETSARLVLIPRDVFFALLDSSPGFRRLVFAAFAERMQSMMQLIENVSFMSVESRLAALILDRAGPDGCLHMTQAEMATAVGTAREVISRRLDKLAQAGAVAQERGSVTILNRSALNDIVRGAAF
ncbi:Crp/Fnr family transcriptional regulator [Aliiroseovarius zhejiangensis]|uniref:Crp/Fnr family transcriptional regulator n=1 Tax=Aliiroseovarius zhejiangensis TaxID=1632025 RepID=A0ABQ3IUR0_9RHOB|nr:Crp/Fnr family transcriptional regulator [Aliiroseovarius zhejiangensis]GHE92231.1 Crp/Fnr family transcriptional regulator [Aliiroseovarius zhejiangensis]